MTDLHRRYPRRARRLVAFLASVTVASTALADPAAQARFHDELAREHYKSGRFEQALREFFLEQRVSPNPRISYNIALCFEDLKRNEDAFQYFGEYLASEDGDAERRAYAERAVKTLEKTLALVRVGSTPAGADIYVDRRELGSYGRTPKVIPLSPGEHRIWLELPGYRAAEATVTARRSEELPLNLAPQRIVGRLSVTSPVAGRAIVRSATGETLREAPTPLEASLPPGSYEVVVTAAGHVPWSGVTHVSADEATAVTAVPQVAPAATGSITVTSNVPGALIELNGEPAGFSPTVLSSVKVGKQKLRVVSSQLVPWSGVVPVAAGERSWLTVSLEEPPKAHIAPATWITAGIGAAALVTGAVLTVLAAGTHDEFQSAPAGSDRNALRERGMALNTAADVAFAAGAAASASALVLYFTTKEVRGRPSAASLSQSK